MGWEKEIEACRRVASRAGDLALEMWARGVVREDKDDASPVTEADRACEQLIVSELAREFPDDGFLGEEGASREGTSGRRWIIDPIDGTRDFLRGLPGWCNLIALEADGDVALGTCNMVSRGELYWAVRGGGAHRNDRPIRVSSLAQKNQSVFCLTALGDLQAEPFADRVLSFLSGFWAARSYGGCLDAVQVVSGHAEGWMELHAKAWDLAPFKILAEEAGARFFNFDGGSSIYGGNAVICVPTLEGEIRAFLSDTA